MSVEQLLVAVSRHYAERDFDDRTVAFLRWIISSNIQSGQFRIHTNYYNFEEPVANLVGWFTPCAPAPCHEELQGAKAIFAFAFGYQLPNPRDQSASTRRPGQNNYQLAGIADGLKARFRLPLCVQFEIARAIHGFSRDGNDFSSDEADMNTKTAVEQFLERAGIRQDSRDEVIVVAHRHHMERCVRSVQVYSGLIALPSPITYAGYDPFECQPRVMSPDEFIVSDFVSMAALYRDPHSRTSTS